MLTLPPALLENWMRQYYFRTEIDIGSSGVEDFAFGELRALLGIECADLDRILFQDSETLGGAALREALARRWCGGHTESVMVTHGSSEANFLVMLALLRPGDEVIVMAPCYQQLFAVAEAIGCRIREWPLRFDAGYRPDFDELRRLLGPQTRMVVVNSPHNPTGAALDRDEQQTLITMIAQTGAFLLWDNAFGALTYDDAPLPEASTLYERAISLGTLSKAYGLPGLRVGWCFAQPDVLERLVRVRDYVTLHLSPLVELVARRVIEDAERLLALRLGLAQTNRQIVSAWMEAHAEWIECVPPRGGVCVFPRFRHVSDTEAFCRMLGETQKVLLVPGECFGCPGHVRLGFGRQTAIVEEGLARLATGVRQTSIPSARS